ncbi:oocyte zinc finger protein XlCOF7.1-like [Hyla sarda]|uniref:oocyte zinc finger protein XlCOF7.1-like n=1 Tax=Hyla sarda TaxID=327740 RepID=UPI0024C26ECA|nr:oocyte zinc finger protein XlCOF7.1-like [Hyla sarda]
MMPIDDATERVLHFTLEIIYLLTGEDYGPLKKPAEAVIPDANSPLSRKKGRNRSSMVAPPPLILEENNEQKILELANKIIELLTGEVPIRCQDFTVYFSMEEWEYLEDHKELYKDVIMEEKQTLISPVELVFPGCCVTHINREYVTEDGEYSTDNSMFAATNHSQEDPSPYVKRDILCSEGKKDTTDMCTDHTDYVSFLIKEEGVLGIEENPSDISEPSSPNEPHPAQHLKGETISFGENLTDIDICITDHTQQYPSSHINEGKNLTNVYSPTEQPQQYPTSIKEGPQSGQQGQRTTIYVTQSHTYSTRMKEEPLSRDDEEELTDADIDTPSGHTQDQSPSVIEDEISCNGENRNTNVYTPTEYEQYTPGHTKDGLELWSKPDVFSFSCSECDKSFHCKSELLMHLPVHSGDKPYNCSVCGKCFTNLSYLITHGKIHAGEKRYSCPDCGVSFTRSSNLKAHKRKHTGEKPYVCPDCGKSFSSNSNLNAHRKRHTGEKPYSCPDCGKSFINRSHLVVHQRTHTGEKPYTCPLCIKCFSNTSDLAKHRKIHNKKPYYCSKCGKCYKSNPDFHNQKLHICHS